ncbi:esterase/lipase family protein [Halorientalis halophila]|uniref:esterase/lipase family protein n=1 Tax=Halorientalis halophila TaxID=3108499 RepID=UPI0030084134
MSVDRGPGRSRPLFQQLTSNLVGLRRCRRNGGCRLDCQHDRTATDRLPWDAPAYGGWGGHEHHDTEAGSSETPVVFVHGNQRDACDWEPYAEFFLNRAHEGDDLWAITFGDGSPSHEAMADQLDDFVGRVREYTGSDRVAVVAHSLGVTGTRYWLHREDRYDWVDACVFMAGANHGTVLSSYAASAGLTGGTYKMSEFLRRDHAQLDDHPLAVLNQDETPGDVDYYTLRGTDDPLFWNCEESPTLEGATNVLLRTDHDGVRANLTSIENTYEWLTGQKPYNLRTTLADRS